MIGLWGFKQCDAMNLADNLIILLYHSVDTRKGVRYSVHRQNFLEQVDLLTAEGFSFFSFRQLLGVVRSGGNIPVKSAILTFDDGYENFFTEVYPVLYSRGIKVSLFITVSLLGTVGMIRREQIEACDPHILEIGSHGMRHTFLPAQSKKTLSDDIRGSYCFFHDNFPRYFVPVFSIPQGVYTRESLFFIQREGFELIVTSDRHAIRKKDVAGKTLPRFPVYGQHTIQDFRALIRESARVSPLKIFQQQLGMFGKVLLLRVFGEGFFRNLRRMLRIS